MAKTNNNIDKMRKKFCPRCGREESEDNPLIDEFCKKCSNMSLIEDGVVGTVSEKQKKLLGCARMENLK